MSEDILIAIDAGGTVVKVVAFDLSGNEMAQGTAIVHTEHHADGRVERDVEMFWQGIVAAVRRVTEQCRGQRILGVGCTGFGNGIFLIDEKGRGTRPGIVSVDHRAQPIVDRLNASNHAATISEVTGNRLWGGQTLMQFAHLALNEPEVMARTRWALACKDFIRFRLTGEVLTDPTDASGGGMMDIEAGEYAFSALESLGVSACRDRLPPIVASHSVAGRVTNTAALEMGLPEGIPVAGSMMDVAACALGAGAVDAPVLTMIAGTWSINSIECDRPQSDATPILNMLYRDGKRLIAEGSPSSAANLGWFLEHGLAGRVTLDEASAMVEATDVTARRCQFLPHVLGPEPRRGAFVGIGVGDNLNTMLRAIFEAVAFQARAHAEKAVTLSDKPFPETIRLAGGAAKAPIWAQIFADICQQRVEVVRASEVGALGAAICAAVACGAYGDLPEAVRNMTHVAREHRPDPTLRVFYDRRFQEFLRLDQGVVQLLTGDAPTTVQQQI
ncbi:FGGY-family carbohydrate kinase [Notoacmeibacter sp. MSK16QG-6]|uniref:FGGY-family carbohydrate kinase n=1 Tax=Notoacmeibacter sp. MSK16QG-6 TaxID=2957982 RepID=UPI00209C8398|nr:FGGY-family carbohydrate kinase [Notoacmeibacter sp. MSK16QG-6]MCP1199587.1 carbohydrate kinase [Notoacmeibacter sp. MSK16QG-6]